MEVNAAALLNAQSEIENIEKKIACCVEDLTRVEYRLQNSLSFTEGCRTIHKKAMAVEEIGRKYRKLSDILEEINEMYLQTENNIIENTDEINTLKTVLRCFDSVKYYAPVPVWSFTGDSSKLLKNFLL